jgi:hypothetical protein
MRKWFRKGDVVELADDWYADLKKGVKYSVEAIFKDMVIINGLAYYVSHFRLIKRGRGK